MDNLSEETKEHLIRIVERFEDQRTEVWAAIEFETIIGNGPPENLQDNYLIAFLMYAYPTFMILSMEHVPQKIAFEMFAEVFIQQQLPGPLFITEEAFDEFKTIQKSGHPAVNHMRQCNLDCFKKNEPPLYELMQECARLLNMVDPPTIKQEPLESPRPPLVTPASSKLQKSTALPPISTGAAYKLHALSCPYCRAKLRQMRMGVKTDITCTQCKKLFTVYE